MNDLRPNIQRAKNAITLIWIVLILDLITLISNYFQYTLLSKASNGDYINYDAASANDARVQLITLLYIFVNIISAITFILWFRRAYFNLHQKMEPLSYEESWASLGWFVPIVRLYRPYQIMKELYVETQYVLERYGLISKGALNTANVGLWWFLWIISNILGQFVLRYSLQSDSIDELMTSTVAGMFANIIAVPLALITIKIVRDYSNVEPMLQEIQGDEDDMPADMLEE